MFSASEGCGMGGVLMVEWDDFGVKSVLKDVSLVSSSCGFKSEMVSSSLVSVPWLMVNCITGGAWMGSRYSFSILLCFILAPLLWIFLSHY